MNRSKFALSAIFFFSILHGQAQWATNGNDISNTNTGNVGIGTTTPTAKLDVVGSLNLSTGGRMTIAGINAFHMAGTRNVAMGPDAGTALLNGATGSNNICIGDGSGQANTTGSRNAFIGFQAGLVNTTGNNNIAIGSRAGYSNTTGNSNAFIGFQAGYTNTTGQFNNFIGYYSGRLTTGSNNTFFGHRTGENTSTGENNTFVGRIAGQGNTTGTGNTYIGSNARGSATITNSTAIGIDANVTQSNSVVIGNSLTNMGIGESAPTQKLHVAGNARITGSIFDSANNPGTAGQVLSSTGTGTQWVTPSGGGGGSSTLDQAYDQGGAGAGRTITADAGAVKVAGTDGFLVTGGTYGSGAGVEVSGTGTRMFFNPKKAAFRAGSVTGNSWDEANIGEGSVALGENTKASGLNSTAFGTNSIASGGYSIALSYNNRASGHYSIAMGSNSEASGTTSIVLGNSSQASGTVSTAFGNYTVAIGDGSTTMGYGTKAPSQTETALGSFNTDYTPLSPFEWEPNDRLFVIGNGTDITSRSDAMIILKNGNTAIGNINPTTKLDVDGQVRIRGGAPGAGKVLTSDANGLASWQTPSGGGSSTLDQAYDQGGAGSGRTIFADAGAIKVLGTDGLLVNGTHGSGATIELSDEGSRMFFNPRKSAFRAGSTTATLWSDLQVGEYSVAMGRNTRATGLNTTAFGFDSYAGGDYSVAIGNSSAAAGESAVSIGTGTSASGDVSSSFGYYTTAPSYAETALGIWNTTYAPASTELFQNSDRLLVVGNGLGLNNRSDALVILKNGNTAIGNINPTSKLDVDGQVKIRGGAPGSGKVLTSDANGLASWQTINSNTLDQSYNSGGPGSGREITAGSGAVKISGTDGIHVLGSFGTGAQIESNTGSQFYFNPRKAATRSGYSSAAQWNDANVGIASVALGFDVTASGDASVAIGEFADALGRTAVGLGHGATAKSFREVAVGSFNHSYTPNSMTTWNAADKIFSIGNGVDDSNRSDAIRVLKSGNTAIGNVDPTAKLDVDGQVRIRGGAPGAGKVLTSDANGLATWQTAGGGTLDQAYDQGGAGAGRTITADAGAVRVSGTDGLLVNGTFGSGANPELTGAGTRMFFNPRKAAFRSGTVSGTQWNTANIGNYSAALGQDNTASGSSSVAMGYGNSASEQSTLALGGTNTASASNAVAIGSANTVNQSFGITVGNSNTATAQSGAAFGNLNNAMAIGATAVGYSNSAAGLQSSAIGTGNIAWGANSMAMGNGSTTNAESSMTLGTGATTHSPAEIALGSHNTHYTPASPTAWNDADRLLVVGNGPNDSNRSDALTILKNGNVGIGQSVPSAKLEVNGQVKITGGNPGAGKVLTSDANGLATWQPPSGGGGGSSTLDQAYDQGGSGAGRTITADAGAVKVAGTDGLLVTGTVGSGAAVEVSGAGTRMFFNPKKTAFRAGYVSSNQWDEANVGDGSVALGYSTVASGDNSTALGIHTTASGGNSTALGIHTTASGDLSTAFGGYSIASGNLSTALGYSTSASGYNSTALGYYTEASGYYSTALGHYNLAIGAYSTASGSTTEASGNISTTLGRGANARSLAETAIGSYNTDYTPISTTEWELTDRLFVIGNGPDGISRNDAMVVLKNGNTGIGSSTPSTKLEVQYNSTMTAPQTLLSETGSGNYARLSLKNTNHSAYWTLAGLNTATAGNDRLNLYHSIAGDVLTLTGGGNVGIGYGTPTYKLAVNGDAAKPGGGSWTVASDARLKQDVNEYKDGLKEVLAIRPVTYRYNAQSGHDTNKEYVGVIAQELKDVAPYMVGSFEKGEQTYLDVDNSAMTYMLINAVKEVNTKVEAVSTEGMVSREEFESVNAKLAEKDAEIAELKSLVNQILVNQRQFEGDLQQCCFEHSNANGSTGLNRQSALDIPQLEQNQPNPFHENTTIKYYLPSGSRTASITISDLNGVQLKSFDLSGGCGAGQVLISGGAFAAGTYVYTLTVNGKQIDSKRMILM